MSDPYSKLEERIEELEAELYESKALVADLLGETEPEPYVPHCSKLEKKLFNEMQEEFENTGEFVNRRYTLSKEDYSKISGLKGKELEHGISVLNGDWGQYYLTYDHESPKIVFTEK